MSILAFVYIVLNILFIFYMHYNYILFKNLAVVKKNVSHVSLLYPYIQILESLNYPLIIMHFCFLLFWYIGAGYISI